jgi:hypothetical protein
MRCPRCGVVDDCVGVPHKCLSARGGRRVTRQREDPRQSSLVGEIADYLASDQGRYDALIAALIIRAR